MNRLTYQALLAALALGAALRTTTAETAKPARPADGTPVTRPVSALPGAEEWKLVWSDEFDREGLPDPQKWDYEEGFIRNGEFQYYTRARKENARVEHGMLVIEGRKEKFRNPYYKPGSGNAKAKDEFAEYTAASLITLNMASWKYGKIEVRAKLPTAKGTWPAIWTKGVNFSEIGWPKCGEIDILEFWGKSPGAVTSNFHFPRGGKLASKFGKFSVTKVCEDFHTYAIEWTDSAIDVFFDGRKYHSFNVDEAGAGDDNPFRKPHYLLLNLAMGGKHGGVIEDAALPQQYLIDYVRVYERISGRAAGKPR